MENKLLVERANKWLTEDEDIVASEIPVDFKYTPIKKSDGSIYFDTEGVDLEKVKEANIANVWTGIDTEEGLILKSGFHFTNRLFYIITEEPVRDEDKEMEFDFPSE